MNDTIVIAKRGTKIQVGSEPIDPDGQLIVYPQMDLNEIPKIYTPGKKPIDPGLSKGGLTYRFVVIDDEDHFDFGFSPNFHPYRVQLLTGSSVGESPMNLYPPQNKGDKFALRYRACLKSKGELFYCTEGVLDSQIKVTVNHGKPTCVTKTLSTGRITGLKNGDTVKFSLIGATDLGETLGDDEVDIVIPPTLQD